MSRIISKSKLVSSKIVSGGAVGGSALLASFLLTERVYAICPVCTVAVGAGLGLAEYLHIDDSISGLWIGALTVSMIMWTINWLNGRKIKFLGRRPLVFLGYYALIVIPLYLQFKHKGVLGHFNHQLWGVDKLFLGIGVGSLLFFLGAKVYLYLKARNNGRAHFPFEKIVLAVMPLVIMSLVFYFLTKK